VALNWFHAGTLPVPARQLATGTILEPASEPDGVRWRIAGVSSADQRDDLDGQTGRVARECTRRGVAFGATVAEVGSGLNGSRPELWGLLSDLAVMLLVVEHVDAAEGVGWG
jgi:putative resolvase